MKKWEIEHHIKSAIETMTPDVYGAAASADIVKEKNEEGIKKERNRIRHKWVYAAGTIAACLLLMIGMQIQTDNVISIIEIDVNPSIEIQVNEADKVVQVIPKNQDGVIVLDNMDLKHADINVASNAILGSMVKKGYINEDNNAILITIQSKKEEKEIALEKKLTKDVNEVLKENQLNAMVLNQKKSSDKIVEKWSEKYNISYGKAAFIYHMTKMDKEWKPSELAVLSISELMELASNSDKVVLSDLVTDSSSYISEKEAEDIVKKKYGKADIFQIKFDYKDGRPIFIIQLEKEEKIYEINMEAYTGKILTEKNLKNEQESEKVSKTDKNKEKETDKVKTQITSDGEKKNTESKSNGLDETNIEQKNENKTKKQEKPTKNEVSKSKDSQSVKQKESPKKTPTPVIVNKEDDSDDSDFDKDDKEDEDDDADDRDEENDNEDEDKEDDYEEDDYEEDDDDDDR